MVNPARSARWLCGFGCALLFACGGGGGGVTHYRPSDAAQRPQLSRDDAEAALIKTLGKDGRMEKGRYTEIWTGDSNFRFVMAHPDGSQLWRCPYSGTPTPEVPHYSDSGGLRRLVFIELGGCTRNGEPTPVTPSWDFPGENADRFADALFVLANSKPVDPAQDSEFQQVAQQYRASGGRLTLTEGARAHRVAAEEAVKEKRFGDAVGEFGEALKLAPWWPQGHYNRALILAELGAYGAAGREMKRYLLLEPDAENARQVQDKIYAWQAKVK